MKITQENVVVAENDAKTVKNNQKEIKMDEKVVKTEQKSVEAEDLKAQYAALKKSNPELVKMIRVMNNATKPQAKKEEVRPMAKAEVKNWRNVGETVLLQVAKELKLTPVRIVPKRTSRSGFGALRLLMGTQVAIAVRENDIIAYKPHSVVGFGYAHEGDWGKWITKLQRETPENMRKAFLKVMRDKKMPHEYRDATDFSYAAVHKGVKVAVADAKATKKQEVADVKKAKARKKAKPKTKAAAAIAAVAATTPTVTEPTVA